MMLSIVVPTYNEANNLLEFYKTISESLQGIEHEIIIVDDASPDKTGELAEWLHNFYGNIKVIHRPRKMGTASAIVDGLDFASGDIICTINADLQHPPKHLTFMLELIDKYDVVVASRYTDGGRGEGESFWRLVTSKVAGGLARILLPKVKGIKDPMSGYFMFKRRVIENAHINPKSCSNSTSVGVKLLLEILVKGSYDKTTEVPYVFKKRNEGKSKFSLKDCFIYLRQLLHLMRFSGETRRILKFCIVGASGVGVNEGLLWLLTEKAGLPYMFSGVLSVESAILSNFTWNELWTFKDLKRTKQTNVLHRALRFNLVRIAGLVANLTILYLLSGHFGIHYLISNLIAIVAATMWNYIASLILVWK